MSPSATPDGDAAMLQFGMADDAEIRRENFRAYWGDNWSPSLAVSRLWGTASQWSDLYHGRKSFGEKLARQIEEKLGLARLSLDDPSGPTAAPLSAALLARLEAASPDERRRLENMLRAHFGMPQLDAGLPALSQKRPKRAA